MDNTTFRGSGAPLFVLDTQSAPPTLLLGCTQEQLYDPEHLTRPRVSTSPLRTRIILTLDVETEAVFKLAYQVLALPKAEKR